MLNAVEQTFSAYEREYDVNPRLMGPDGRGLPVGRNRSTICPS